MPSFHESTVLDGVNGRLLESATAYGKGNTVYCRYADGCDQGDWPRLKVYMQPNLDLSAVWRDSTVGRAQNKETAPALNRNRGGFSTPTHSLTDGKAALYTCS